MNGRALAGHQVLDARQRDTYSIGRGSCPEKLALRETGRIEFPPQATACDLHLAINIEGFKFIFRGGRLR